MDCPDCGAPMVAFDVPVEYREHVPESSGRAALEELLVATERAGVDPLLVLDRLHAQGGVQPGFDLDRRRHQLQQLLD